MSIFIFLAILFVLVLVHELGHFAVAKWMGMRVDEFGIGFPPKLFGIKRGETEYTLNLFPIGGFVKIYGENGIGDESQRVEPSNGNGRSFTAKSRTAQALVLVAGVTMNVLLAWLLFAVAFSVGVRTSVSEAEATDAAVLTITSVMPESPAAKAELPLGVGITGAVSGNDALTTLTPSAFSAFVAEHGAEEIVLTYTKDGTEQATTLKPQEGLIADDASRAAIGVSLAQVEIVKRSIGRSIIDAGAHTIASTKAVAVGIAMLVYDSIRFEADFSQVAGPVGIVGLVGEASAYGFTTLLTFTAFISLNLAVINILPFPALDGGRLLFVVIEAIKGSPIKAQYAATLNTLGFFLLIALMVAVTWSDIARLI
jgi:regulator of sigma E protease